MPGLTTHTYILYKALSTYAGESSLFAKVKASHEKAVGYARKDEHSQFSFDHDCSAAGAAYIGACGPDLFYLEMFNNWAAGSAGFLADLMHYNKTGPYMLWCLRNVKKSLPAAEEDLRHDLLLQFAYCLGHISHIAADITMHPYVNSIVRAYPDNAKSFEDARGWNGLNVWRFHNTLEQYQDAYVLHRCFFKDEGFAPRWLNVNIAGGGAYYLGAYANWDEWFLVRNAKGFYKFKRNFSRYLESGRYRFFLDTNLAVNVSHYYENTLPSEAAMDACPQMVQGRTYDATTKVETKGLFDAYLEDAVAETKKLWAEVERYLGAEQSDFTDPQMGPEKQHCPLLRRHWNLDTGLAPRADAEVKNWTMSGERPFQLQIAGTLAFVSARSGSKGDVVV